MNFQESTTILNACTKNVWELIEYTTYIYIYFFKKKQNLSHSDYKFVSILLWVFDINQKHQKNLQDFFISYGLSNSDTGKKGGRG